MYVARRVEEGGPSEGEGEGENKRMEEEKMTTAASDGRGWKVGDGRVPGSGRRPSSHALA